MGLLDTANVGDIFERQLIISEDLMKRMFLKTHIFHVKDIKNA